MGQNAHYVAARNGAAPRRKAKCDPDWCAKCIYCSAPLSSRHEHDHMPTPFRHGGEDMYAVCLNCHDLKDRMDFTAWNISTFMEAFGSLPPVGKIMAAKLIAEWHDFKAMRDE